MTPRRINPPHYFLFALVAIVALRFVPAGGAVLPPPWQWAGLGPVVLGVALAVIAAGRFSRAGTNIVPLTKSSALVTDGPFAFTRNPMYLGMILVLVGAAVLVNTGLPWLVVALFVAVIQLRFVRHEEALMEKTFGADYRAYRSRVRRWL